MKMVVVFKILFLVLIAHSAYLAQAASAKKLASSREERPPPLPPPVLAGLRIKQQLEAATTKSPSEAHLAQVWRSKSSEYNENATSEPDKITRRQHEESSSLDSAAEPDGRPPSVEVRVDETSTNSGEPSSQLPLSTGGHKKDASVSGPRSGEKTKAAAAGSTESVNYAELCYLSNGGSSLTLTVNEATQVGSIIGTVEVNGDPSLEQGDVDLFLASDGAAAIGISRQPQQQVAGNGSSSIAASGHETDFPPPPSPAAPGKQRRILGRRSLSLASQHWPAATPTSDPHLGGVAGSSGNRAASKANEAGHLVGGILSPAGGRRARREPKQVSSVQLQPPPSTTSSSLMGLVSDYQSGGASHSSASYYSLVASTASPSWSAPPAPGQVGTTPGAPQVASQGPAVRLEPGTRSLVLARPLDKESAEGELGIMVEVRCRPRAGSAGRADSSTIPVRILVTDANDHAPEFVGNSQPYVVNISETAPIGAVVARDILAMDRDSAGPFSTLHYRILEDGSAHSALLQFASPLEPTLLVAGQLDYESLPSFALTIVAEDQGEPEPLSSTAQVLVNVIDFDDQNPKFLDDKYTLIMDETQQGLVGQNLQVLPRNLYAEDGDRAINAPILYSFDQLGGSVSSTGESGDSKSTGDETTAAGSSPSSALNEEPSVVNVEHYLHLNPSTGELRLLRQWPAKWQGAPMTLVVRATQADNKDRYTLTTLTITRPPVTSNGGARTPGRISGEDSPMAGERVQLAGASEQVRAAQPPGVGLQFWPDRLNVSVPESAPVGEKIARVRARYLNSASDQSPASNSTSEAVDLIQDWQLRAQNKSKKQHQQQQQQRRPINYQILDDQTDQFGINGLGEIFVKRQLDYEQRHEYKFRVLATYTKYSDICQVQVSVGNVNDNKPKFTQSQYTFHLTESRLRSNLIGQVQAHDSDLNDTIRYSLSGEHAHLFDIGPTSGQISLRASIKQLNVTGCQLIAQASDTLGGPGGQHQHQARVHLHVAPQLVGRSINFEQQPGEANNSKLFNQRSLINPAGDTSSWATTDTSTWTGGPPQTRGQSRANNNNKEQSQRSSVATVMSSLQHMVRSVNFLEMPMSSALLLSALLAFLVCLLFIVIISMSVHLFRRRSKLRHRHHLAAAAHLRHAHMAAALRSPGTGSEGPNGGPGGRYLRAGSHSSPNSSPTNSTAAGGSSSSLQQHHNRQLSSSSPQSLVGGGRGRGSRATEREPGEHGGNMTNNDMAPGGSGADAAAMRPASAARNRAGSAAPSSSRLNLSPVNLGALETGKGGADMSFISTLSSQSKRSYRSNTTDDSSVMHCGHYSVTGSQVSPRQQQQQANKQQQQQQVADAAAGVSSRHHKPGGQQARQKRATAVEAAIKSLVRESSPGSEADEEEDEENRPERKLSRHEGAGETAGAQVMQRHRNAMLEITSKINSNNKQQQLLLQHQQQLASNELSVLTHSKPGIKSYRKLPLGSLARPLRSNRVVPETSVSGHESAAQVSDQRSSQTDSAIASEASSSGGSGGHHTQNQQVYAGSPGEGLMAMIRDPDHQRRPTIEQRFRPSEPRSVSAQSQHSIYEQQGDVGQLTEGGVTRAGEQTINGTIRWPQSAMPQRVKRLTWDDELSISNDGECFIAPDLPALPRLGGAPISPLSSSHQYPIQGTTNSNDQYAEQHFLFSNPCSPALFDASSGNSFSGHQSHQVNGTTSHHRESNSAQNSQTAAHRVATGESTGISLASQLMVATGNGSALLMAPPGGGLSSQQPQDEPASMMGQNNCFDYTIVQSSQFHVDAFASEQRLLLDAAIGHNQQESNNNNHHHNHNQQSLSAQHHLLQQQLGGSQLTAATQQQSSRRPVNSYLYSNSFINNHLHQQSNGSEVAGQQPNQDLKLMTTVVL